MAESLITLVRAYLTCVEQGNTDAVVAFYAPDAIQVELPNRLKTKGDRRGVAQMAVDMEKGKTLLSRQSYEVLHHAERENYVVVEVRWRGTLAVPFGTLAAGSEMVAHSAIAFSFEHSKIVRQRNYDCFEDF